MDRMHFIEVMSKFPVLWQWLDDYLVFILPEDSLEDMAGMEKFAHQAWDLSNALRARVDLQKISEYQEALDFLEENFRYLFCEILTQKLRRCSFVEK